MKLDDSTVLLILLGVLAILAASLWIWAETAEIKHNWTREDSKRSADLLDAIFQWEFLVFLPIAALIAGLRHWPRTRTATLILLGGIASTGLGFWILKL